MDTKRYYWIKLKTEFFNQDTIDFLLSQNNGCEYVVLYQMLCLKTANNGGVLSTNIGEIIVPYDVEKIARDTKYFNEDTIRVALELYKQLGLIYEGDNNLLYITGVNEMVGSETKYAEKMRKYRDKKKDYNVAYNVRQEIEYRDKSIDIDIEKEKELYTYIEQNFGRTLSPIEIEKVQKWLSSFDIDIIKHAVEMAVLKCKRNFKYIDGILNNWKDKTLPEILDDDKTIGKGWKDKDIKKESMTDEEIEEMQNILKEFKK